MKEVKPQIREAQLRADSVNVDERTADFVISSEAVDSYGTVFKASGWDLSRYEKNPVVTFQHRDWDPDPDMVIGTSSVRFEDDKMIATLRFEEGNEVAEKVFRKVQNGILRGASIHASVMDARYGAEDLGEDPDVIYFTRQQLNAWSVVTLPSNPDAVKRNAEGIQELLGEKQDQTPEPTPEPKGNMSRFEAQLINNSNKRRCENL